MKHGDVLGHEAMGEVVEVGKENGEMGAPVATAAMVALSAETVDAAAGTAVTAPESLHPEARHGVSI